MAIFPLVQLGTSISIVSMVPQFHLVLLQLHFDDGVGLQIVTQLLRHSELPRYGKLWFASIQNFGVILPVTCDNWLEHTRGLLSD
uniref:Uncharacterized protein n=1 Tax=Cucumis melo TaxID=3656 RepID=A0A9I9EIZ1_CUCME